MSGLFSEMGGKSMQAMEWVLTVNNIDQDEDNNKLTKVNPQLTQRFGTSYLKYSDVHLWL